MSVDYRYIRIASKVWQDDKFRVLSDEAKILYLYVLTSPHSNMIGYYRLPKPYAAYDLQWLPERLNQRFAELLEVGLVKYCDKSDVVLIPNFLKYNTIQNPNQAKKAVSKLREIPANVLVDEFFECVKQYAQPFEELFAKALPERFGNTVTVSVTVTESVSASSATVAQTDAQVAFAKNVEDDDDDDDDDPRGFLDDLAKEFASAYGYPPNHKQVDMLVSFVQDGMAEDLVLEALKRSAENGATNPSYTKTILQSWLAQRIMTLDDLRTMDAARRPSRARGPLARDDFTYSEIKQQDLSEFKFLSDVLKEDAG